MVNQFQGETSIAMIEIAKELLDNIQEAIRPRFRRGENGWEHGEYEEDTLVGGLFRQTCVWRKSK